METKYVVVAVVGVLVLLVGLAMPAYVDQMIYECSPDNDDTFELTKNPGECDGEPAPFDSRITRNGQKLPAIALGAILTSVGAVMSVRSGE